MLNRIGVVGKMANSVSVNVIEDKWIRDIMSRNIVSVSKTDSYTLVKEKLDSFKINHLPVVENKKVIGIVSANDILRFVFCEQIIPNENQAKALLDQTLKVEDFMTGNPTVLPHDATMKEAVYIFKDSDFHSLPVVAQNGDIIGIVTTKDVMEHVLRMMD